MKFPTNLALHLNLSINDSSLRNSVTFQISITIIGLGFFLIGFSDGNSSSVMESSLSESMILSVSLPVCVLVAV